MAKDEAIFLSYRQNKLPTLRIYTWRTLGISLGYRQQATAILNLNTCRIHNIPIVRRITGGGAILHHKELTYSLVCNVHDLSLPRNVKNSYRILNAFLIHFYRNLGLKTYFADEVFSNTTSRPDNFCFLSCEPLDIVAEGRKIGGNAQRRSKDIIFQQGSIPLTIEWDTVFSLFKTADESLQNKTVSLNQLLHREGRLTTLCYKLMDSFINTFTLDYTISKLTETEKNLLTSLILSKYSKNSWNLNYEADL